MAHRYDVFDDQTQTEPLSNSMKKSLPISLPPLPLPLLPSPPTRPGSSQREVPPYGMDGE